jgi:hypothetical protein
LSAWRFRQVTIGSASRIAHMATQMAFKAAPLCPGMPHMPDVQPALTCSTAETSSSVKGSFHSSYCSAPPQCRNPRQVITSLIAWRTDSCRTRGSASTIVRIATQMACEAAPSRPGVPHMPDAQPAPLACRCACTEIWFSNYVIILPPKFLITLRFLPKFESQQNFLIHNP